MPDFSAAHPTNTRDGAALLNARFAGRAKRPAPEPAPEPPVESTSVAAQLIATWFAPVQAAEEDG